MFSKAYTKNLFTKKEQLESMPRVLYHYCGFDTGMKILSGKKIWLSHVTKMNDPHELGYIIPIVTEAIKKVILYYNNKFEFATPIDVEGAYSFEEKYVNEYSKMIYAVCFSENTELVDQWTRYADHARGMAIGFSTFPLVKMQTDRTSFAFGKVVYGGDYLCNEIKDIIINTYEDQKSRKQAQQSYVSNESLKIDLYDIFANCFKAYIECAYLFKHPTFSQEREWRLVFNPYMRIRGIVDMSSARDLLHDAQEESKYPIGFIKSEFKYRCIHNSDITSYIELDFSQINRELIKEVILGAQTTCQAIDSDMYEFMKNNGYSLSNITSSFLGDRTFIHKSTIPYQSYKRFE